MTRLRVGINLLWLLPGVAGGAEEYAVRVLRALDREAADDLEVTLLSNRRLPAVHPDLAGRFPTAVAPVDGGSRAARIAIESTWLAREAARRRLDVVHHLNNVAPWVRNRPSVLTVHDLRPIVLPETLGRAHGAYLRSRLLPSVRASSVVTTPSEFVRRTVIEMLDAEPSRVLVVSAPLPLPLGAGETDPDPAVGRPFFVYPAVTNPHKNHLTLLLAFSEVVAAHPEAVLVLTGAPGPVEAEVRAAVSRLGLGGSVRRLGRVPAGRLHRLLRDAAGLVYPSRYEGFGLPVVEAMALGCPVVASDATALPEIVGEAGLLVGPDDAGGWATAMLRLLDDPALRDRLVAAGHERAGSLTPARTAEQSVAAYRMAARGR